MLSVDQVRTLLGAEAAGKSVEDLERIATQADEFARCLVRAFRAQRYPELSRRQAAEFDARERVRRAARKRAKTRSA